MDVVFVRTNDFLVPDVCLILNSKYNSIAWAHLVQSLVCIIFHTHLSQWQDSFHLQYCTQKGVEAAKYNNGHIPILVSPITELTEVIE